MGEKKVAFMVSDEQFEKIEELKKESYYNKPYSDLLRDLIDAGIKAKKKKGA